MRVKRLISLFSFLVPNRLRYKFGVAIILYWIVVAATVYVIGDRLDETLLLDCLVK